MRASIRRFHSPDVEDLAGWTPPDSTCFGFLLQVLIGPVDSEGEESFDFIVATPGWLRQRHGGDAVVVARHHLVVFAYDYVRITSAVEALVSAQEARNWHDLAMKLGRYGMWEFEDYRE